jgi:hypothetical protein
VAAAATGVTIVAPALAANSGQAGRAATHAAVSREVPGLALIAPTARTGGLSPATTGKAVKTCVYYASRAGWPNNGYYGGDLVTAAAICVAESAGNPDLIVCDNAAGGITGQGNYPGYTCPEPETVSYDRGLWQLNTAAAKTTTNACAFNPVCNAGQAYLYSGRGTSFAAWSSYDQDTYAGPFIDLVQAGVLALGSGTVTSALLGECLAQAKPALGAKLVLANCGSGAENQLWSPAGGKLTSGRHCAAIASSSARKPGIVLQRCVRSRSQDWSVTGRDELRNAADGKCLTDPGASLTAGTQVTATSCANAKDQTWWLP